MEAVSLDDLIIVSTLITSLFHLSCYWIVKIWKIEQLFLIWLLYSVFKMLNDYEDLLLQSEKWADCLNNLIYLKFFIY